MSLKAFLKNNDVKDKFAKEFEIPAIRLTGQILAPPQTTNYSLVGTAFDYLMRFYLGRINPKAIKSEWVAENAPKRLLTILAGNANAIIEIDCETGKASVRDTLVAKQSSDLGEKVEKILNDAKKEYEKYLKTGELNDELFCATLLLAQLDPIYRAGIIDPHIGTIDANDIQDLKNLVSLIDENKFKCRNVCVLNPTFGKAFALIGGADADLLIDDALIEIKTTKFLKLQRDDFDQLIGYYVLCLIGEIRGLPKKIDINFLAIYFSRHAFLLKIPVEEIVKNHNMPEFIKWFEKRANTKISKRS